MSKKNKKTSETFVPSSPSISHAAEYHIIKHDLLRVIVLNLIYLAALLGVYFTNQKSHYLEKFVQSIVKF